MHHCTLTRAIFVRGIVWNMNMELYYFECEQVKSSQVKLLIPVVQRAANAQCKQRTMRVRSGRCGAAPPVFFASGWADICISSLSFLSFLVVVVALLWCG
jgi:hypothetical protein